MNTKIILSLMFCSIVMGQSYSQSIPAAENVHFFKEFSDHHFIPEAVLDTLTNPMGLLTPNDTLTYSVSLRIPDTLVTQNVQIKLGTSQGASNLFNQTFLLTSSNSLLFYRQSDHVTILLGSYLNNAVYHCQVILSSASGNQSTIVAIRSDQ